MKYRILIFRLLVIGVMLFGATGKTNLFAQEDAFDGKVYIVKVEEENTSGSIEYRPDEILFKEGTVSSGFSVRNGFTNAVYEIEAETIDGLTTYYFSGTGTAKNGETLTWIIAITETYISGEAERPVTGTVYVFDGKLK